MKNNQIILNTRPTRLDLYILVVYCKGEVIVFAVHDNAVIRDKLRKICSSCFIFTTY